MDEARIYIERAEAANQRMQSKVQVWTALDVVIDTGTVWSWFLNHQSLYTHVEICCVAFSCIHQAAISYLYISYRLT